ncbi:ABC transporter ATP-binding protein [Radiobacillus kanasensis]|uniref:ABC transporter ATP-binding protein n=1 Tax=Radiobacillus kanasensis TaxID=2844358 RepID=UPI001E4153F4|nr:ABC transporter ATP-binding protein [Radiobacillus kanasensis]UFU00024.1 ABC transporter ATP-binding protein [Radiobacillus kanasensis]
MKIEVKQLTKQYKEKLALNSVSFALEEPKIYGLLGRNGAGKTTFMELLTGLILPNEGEILIDGQRPFENRKLTESICFIREGQNFKKDLSIKNVLVISSLFYPNWDQSLAERLMEEFHLTKGMKVKALSKGMESALGIIVGLASKAPITMFDEPYIGLDAAARSRFYELLMEEYENEKRLIIFSTHLIDEVSSLFEEVLIFEDGKLKLQEDTDSLRERCYSITGPTKSVESFVHNKQVIHQKSLAGMSTAVIMDDNKDVQVGAPLVKEGVSIQDLMIHLTARKGEGVHE